MNKLIIANNESLTMLSNDLLSLINIEREKFNERPVRLNQFNNRVIDELEGEDYKTFVVENSNKTTSNIYELTIDQCMLVSMRESKSVRKSVLVMLNKTQPQHNIPQTYSAALLLAGQQAEQIELQNKQLELQAPKVKFVDNCVERGQLMTATQVAQKHKLSAVKLNRFLDELECVYNKSVKRGRAFKTNFVVDGLGEMKQTELGYSQALFTAKGEQWVNQQLISEGMI